MNKKNKLKKWSGLLCFAITALFIASCRKQPDNLEEALTLAGKNRPELEKVLSHYSSNPADSLKLKAARFLIENMPAHYYHRKNEELYNIMDSLNRSDLSTDEVYARFDSIKKTVKASPAAILPDIQTLSSTFLIRHIDDVFELWEQTPWKDQIRFGDFCEYILPYAVSSEKRENWVTYYRSKYLPYIEPLLHLPDTSAVSHANMCHAMNDSLLVSSRRIVFYDEGISSYPPTMNDRIRSGNCDDYVARTTFLMRSLGIPTGRDFAPQWAGYSLPHTWSTLLDEDRHTIPYAGFEARFDKWTLDDRINYPKMFRYTYSIQKQSLAAQKLKEPVPGFLKQANIMDVTKEYVPVADVSLSVSKPDGIRTKTAYLCVFNNTDWMAVQWSFVKRGKATFKDMGRKVIYLPAYYTGENFIAANDPFMLDSLGKVIPLRAGKEKETLVLTRKYHNKTITSSYWRALNGRFQGSNKPDFSDGRDLYVIGRPPERFFQTIDMDTAGKFRYVRYVGGKGSYSNIAELEFYTKDTNRYVRLSGNIIGTEGSAKNRKQNRKEAALDGDILSYFDAPVDSGGWVGLDLGSREKIDRIRFLPRTDDNYIRSGDLYELFYWDKGGWNSMGQQTGDESHQLIYENCPAGALFLLHNHTRGKEERIFTYENGKQVFW